LIGVGAGEEQARKVHVDGPPGVEQTSRLGSRGPVANGIKCGPHGGKNSKTKPWTVPWLSLKAKIKSGQRGGQVMSGDWQEATPSQGLDVDFVVNHWKPRRFGVVSRQSPLMTWPSHRPGSILALMLNQGTVHDFILLFLSSCDPHLIPSATGSLEPSLLVCPPV
jgi:hypothetical protein